MSIANLLNECARSDVKLMVKDGRLLFDAAEGAMNDLLKANIVRHKSALIAHLQQPDQPMIADPWQPVRELRLQPEDKTFILGVAAGMRLDNAGLFSMLQRYAIQYRKAADRQPVEHRKSNTGLYAANVWLRERFTHGMD